LSERAVPDFMLRAEVPALLQRASAGRTDALDDRAPADPPPRSAADPPSSSEPKGSPAAGAPLSAFPPAGVIFDSPPAGSWSEFVVGVFDGMPFDQYRAIEAMSQSGAQKINRSPLHFRIARDAPSAPSDAMLFGTAVHDGVLEPEHFAARVCMAPDVNRRTNAGREAWADFLAANAGRIVLAREDFDCARRCIDAVLDHPAASRLLEGARREVSLFWIDGKYRVPCKARLDILNHGGIGDVKTTRDASPEEFAKSIANYGYDIQAANYFSGHEHLLNATPDFFVFVTVESEAPHAVACYELGSASILAGARKMDAALERYARALKLGRWEGYPATIERIDTPPWARRFSN
jgi:exodeoxyribonuclease VIII